MPVFISPTEHSAAIQRLGRTSPLCEYNGVDVLSVTSTARIGFQRKETRDFFASVSDGRLQKELLQMEASSILTHTVLLLEGNFDWTTDGQSTIPRNTWTKAQFRSLITSIQLRGIIVHFTTNPQDTADIVDSLTHYLSKPKHSSLSRRPNQVDSWGRATNRSFACHLLQSFPGVGPELADRIYKHFGGAPIQWTVDQADLASVKGIGDKRAESLIGALAVSHTVSKAEAGGSSVPDEGA